LLRTHTCGELRSEHIDTEVTFVGGLTAPEIMGAPFSLDLRDRYGKTQVVASPESGRELVEEASRLRAEDVVQVTGRVAARPAGTVNPKLATGEIEVRITASSSEQEQDAALHAGTPIYRARTCVCATDIWIFGGRRCSRR
jgi:aspartyl-tRNA synthetase